MSAADLHEELGRLCADPDGMVRTKDHAFDARQPSALRSVDPVSYPDLRAAERLAEAAADARAEMGEDRWAQLNAEWLA